MKCWDYWPWGSIYDTSFLYQLTNGPNKPEWFTTLCWKGLPGTNNLAYWAHSKVMKKMKCCEYGTWSCIHNASFSSQLTNGPIKPVIHYTMLERLARDKQSSLLGPFESKEEIEVLWMRHLKPYSQCFIFFPTYEWAQQASVFTKMERLARDKHSSLLGPFKRYAVLWMQHLGLYS